MFQEVQGTVRKNPCRIRCLTDSAFPEGILIGGCHIREFLIPDIQTSPGAEGLLLQGLIQHINLQPTVLRNLRHEPVFSDHREGALQFSLPELVVLRIDGFRKLRAYLVHGIYLHHGHHHGLIGCHENLQLFPVEPVLPVP